MLALLWAAFALGIATSIAPCPLATNIAAISYVGRKVESSRTVILAGLLYTSGRAAAYVGISLAIAYFTLSVSEVTYFLNTHIHPFLGPPMILIGMFLVGLISFQFNGRGVSEGLQRRVDAMGVWGALPLGIVFALSFCPYSALLFAGVIGLILKADASHSRLLIPVMYGIGTGLPVVVFAILLARSAQLLGKAYGVLTKVEWWARMIMGMIFVLVGIWFCLKYIFEVL